MPTYVYKFTETGETIEIQQSFRDDALTEAVHPDTGETMPVKKVFLPVGITFKGDGFYKTDNRQKKSATRPAASDSTKSAAATTSDGASSSSAGDNSNGDSSSTPASSTSGASSNGAAPSSD